MNLMNEPTMVAWSKESPDKAGWWWLNRNEDSCVVKVVPFGNRLCAFVPTVREWLPVEEITRDVIPCRWGGPIPLPSESPNAPDRRPKHGKHSTTKVQKEIGR